MARAKFLLDEDTLGLAEIVERHNLFAEVRIDLIAVGGDDFVPRGTGDDAILIWAEEHDRILITRDCSTMQTWLKAHLASGRTSPGVFILRRDATTLDILDHLELATAAGTPEDFANRIEWIP